jgi:hypothetical protein
VSSRWPAIFCVGAIEATSQESMAAPAIEPTAPPIVAALTPRMEPPIEPPIAVPAPARIRNRISAPGVISVTGTSDMTVRDASASGSRLPVSPQSRL